MQQSIHQARVCPTFPLTLLGEFIGVQLAQCLANEMACSLTLTPHTGMQHMRVLLHTYAQQNKLILARVEFARFAV